MDNNFTANTEAYIASVLAEVTPHYVGSCAVHGIEHVMAVTRCGMRIVNHLVSVGGYTDNLMEQVVTASLWHDVTSTSDRECHQDSGAEVYMTHWREANDGVLTHEEAREVEGAIRTHRFSLGLTPTSLVGDILKVADRMSRGFGVDGLVEAAFKYLQKFEGTDAEKMRDARAHVVEKFGSPTFHALPYAELWADEVGQFQRDIAELRD